MPLKDVDFWPFPIFGQLPLLFIANINDYILTDGNFAAEDNVIFLEIGHSGLILMALKLQEFLLVLSPLQL